MFSFTIITRRFIRLLCVSIVYSFLYLSVLSHSLIKRQQGCFLFGAATNRAAMKIHMQVFKGTQVSISLAILFGTVTCMSPTHQHPKHQTPGPLATFQENWRRHNPDQHSSAGQHFLRIIRARQGQQARKPRNVLSMARWSPCARTPQKKQPTGFTRVTLHSKAKSALSLHHTQDCGKV